MVWHLQFPLAAQVILSEIRDDPSGKTKIVSSLRSPVALLTLGSALMLIPVYFLSLVISAFAPSLVTVLPPFLVTGAILLMLYFVEGD